jgi:hypothetical protein
MAGIAGWSTADKASNPWDHVYFDGEELVCDRVTVDDGEIQRSIDVKPRKGEDGADYTDNGIQPATFTLTVEWFTAQSAAEGEALIEKLFPRTKGSVAQPITITHPKPNEAGIERVLVKGIGLPRLSPGGIRSRRISLVEYTPAAPKKAKPGGGAKAGTVGYGSHEDDAKAISDYYAAQQQEILDDIEAGRVTPDDGAAAFVASNEDQMTALQDLYAAHAQPAEQSTVDKNGFEGWGDDA